MKHIFLLFTLILASHKVIGQNIETIKFKPKVGVSGGINLGGQLYSVKGIDARRSPFSWVVSGNVGFKIGMINVPVSFSFRDQQFSYGASFNKFGISPYYKWVKLHIGHRSMRFSKYSMSGKNFFGFGADLTPGKFRISAFKGNLRNPLAVRDTLVFGAVLLPTYKRKATGAKVGFGKSNNHVDLIFLKIKDDLTEGEINPGETANRSVDLNPAENLVMGTEWRFRLFKRLSINGSLNASAYTENTNIEATEGDELSIGFFNDLTTVNRSSKLSFAGDLGANITLDNVRFGIEYRRIEPNYRSLGIAFIQSDIQATTFSAGVSLFKQRVILDGRLGLEKNNLRNLDYTGRKRVLTSLRATVIPNTNLTFNLNHANYQYETVDGIVEINDTLRYINANQTTSLNASYSTKGDDLNYGAFGTVVRQTVKDRSPILRITDDIINYNFTLGIRLKWNPTDLNIKPSLNYARFELVDRTNSRIGCGVKATKGILEKKLRISLNSRINYNSVNAKSNGHVWTNKLGFNYKVNDHNSIILNLGVMDKAATIGKTFTEFRSNISYGYRF